MKEEDKELAFMPAVQMAQLIRSRKLSPIELTNFFLKRIERLNPALLAYCTVTPELAQAAAKRAETAIMKGHGIGALCGVPVSIKDLVLTKGVRTTRGSLLYKDFVPDEDAPLVERVLKAGAVLLGKTNTPEYGWRGTTDNKVFGISRNPWNTEMTPGGSSGGASAAVAAGLGPLALGTDGGGSIRIPASFAGIYGIKPSAGRVPVYPTSASGDFSHAGPMTRTVEDAALFLNVMAGPDYRDRTSLPADNTDYLKACEEGRAKGLKGVKVAWSPTMGFDMKIEPEVAEKTKAAAMRFAELGCELVEESPTAPYPGAAFQVIWFVGLANALSYVLEDEEKAKLLDPGLLWCVQEGAKFSGIDYARAQLTARPELAVNYNHFFEKYDLLLTPTMPLTAFEAGTYAPKAIGGVPVEQTRLGWSPFTSPFNMTGQPSASVPCGFDSAGLPIGLQITGRRFADYDVIKASAAFESLMPWADYYPTVS